MKQSAILDIFHGIKGNLETLGRQKGANEHDDAICDAFDNLKEKLSPDLLVLHQKFVDVLEAYYCDAIDFYYAEGFKLGVLVGIECKEE